MLTKNGEQQDRPPYPTATLCLYLHPGRHAGEFRRFRFFPLFFLPVLSHKSKVQIYAERAKRQLKRHDTSSPTLLGRPITSNGSVCAGRLGPLPRSMSLLKKSELAFWATLSCFFEFTDSDRSAVSLEASTHDATKQESCLYVFAAPSFGRVASSASCSAYWRRSKGVGARLARTDSLGSYACVRMNSRLGSGECRVTRLKSDFLGRGTVLCLHDQLGSMKCECAESLVSWESTLRRPMLCDSPQ